MSVQIFPWNFPAFGLKNTSGDFADISPSKKHRSTTGRTQDYLEPSSVGHPRNLQLFFRARSVGTTQADERPHLNKLSYVQTEWTMVVPSGYD